MRKFLIPILLASVAATPALAQTSREDRQAAREERQQAREQARENRQSAREDRRSHNDQSTQSTRVAPASPQMTVKARDRATVQTDRAQAIRDRIEQRRDNRAQSAQSTQVKNGQTRPTARVRTQAENSRIAQQKDMIEARRKAQRDSRRVYVSRVPQYGAQPPVPTTSRPTPTPTWDSSRWRHDHRYNWSNYRYNNGWLFNLGYYNDPYGFGYYPYSSGYRMWPSYYQSSFWINDPWMYRLPYPPPGTRWVRYFNDAVLVDTWSGQVMDVVYDFFW